MNRPRSGAPDAPRSSVDHNAQLIVDQCLDAATVQRASDIHIEPQSDRLVFRLRVDGRLKIWKEYPLEMLAQVVSRVKVMARMDISEKRMPQDGRFSVQSPEGPRDYR